MRKKLKPIAVPRAEGRAAARVGQGRNTNPYPQSAPNDRDDWFKGYDEAVNKSAGREHKRK